MKKGVTDVEKNITSVKRDFRQDIRKQGMTT